MKAAIIDPPFDPFCDVPWEVIYDDAGRAIGEVFLLKIPDQPSKKRRKKLEPSY